MALIYTLTIYVFGLKAQLGWSQKDVVEEYGKPDRTGYTDDREYWYVGYDSEFYTEASGIFTQVKVCYFLKNSLSSLCAYWCLFLPRQEVNSSVKLFNKQFVKVGEMEWKDYTSQTIYTIEVAEDLCIVRCIFDFN